MSVEVSHDSISDASSLDDDVLPSPSALMIPHSTPPDTDAQVESDSSMGMNSENSPPFPCVQLASTSA